MANKETMMNKENKPYPALRPDAQAFDEVRIITVPRYKQSGLSGDEWRISGVIQLFRKGNLVLEEGYRDVETAAKFLPYVLAKACDDGKAYFAGEKNYCDQEGCNYQAVRYFLIKKEYCIGGGNCGQEKKKFSEKYRKFCEKHKVRGDCGLEDADENYTEIDSPTAQKEVG